MTEKICPKCGSSSTRYRRRTDDYACTRCDFSGAALRPGERERALYQLHTKIDLDLSDRFLEGRAPLRPCANADVVDDPEWTPREGSFDKAYVEDRRCCPHCESIALRARKKTDDFRCARCGRTVSEGLFEKLEVRNALTHAVAQFAHRVIARQSVRSGEVSGGTSRGTSSSGVVLAAVASAVASYLTWNWTVPWDAAFHWSATALSGIIVLAVTWFIATLIFASGEVDAEEKVWRREHAILASPKHWFTFQRVKDLARATNHDEAREEIRWWWRYHERDEAQISMGVNLATLAAVAQRYKDDGDGGKALFEMMSDLQRVLKEIDREMPSGDRNKYSTSDDDGDEDTTDEHDDAVRTAEG
jgi:predicted RNA-binding Zn-ribbon protein involved in translation (DUF1610 family)